MNQSTATARAIEDASFVKAICCGDCGMELNRTVPLRGFGLWDRWTDLVFGGAFGSPACPKGCRSTFSDININTRSEILDADTGVSVSVDVFKFLLGRFYSEDYAKVCDCAERADGSVYVSAHYPAVHGPCGRWIEAYR